MNGLKFSSSLRGLGSAASGAGRDQFWRRVTRLRVPLAMALLAALLSSAACSRAGSNGESGSKRLAGLVSTETVRAAIVHGENGGADWLAADGSGGAEATGYLLGVTSAWQTPSGEAYLIALEIPHVVGGLNVHEVVPLEVTQDTAVSAEGKALPVAAVNDEAPGLGDFDPTEHWVVVQFESQQSGLRAKSLAFQSREVTSGPWPDDAHYAIDLSRALVALDSAASLPERGAWLDAGGGGRATLLGRWGMTTSSTESMNGYRSSADFAVPDHLGSGIVYHCVRVFYPSDSTPGSPSAEGLVSVRVKLDQSRLVIDRGAP